LIRLSAALGDDGNLHIACQADHLVERAAAQASPPSFGMTPAHKDLRGLMRARELD
jgi:hypothetical protein